MFDLNLNLEVFMTDFFLIDDYLISLPEELLANLDRENSILIKEDSLQMKNKKYEFRNKNQLGIFFFIEGNSIFLLF